MRKIKIKAPNLKKLKDKFDKFSIDAASSSGKLKYKTSSALDKTKELLNSLKHEEEEFLTSKDLNDLQSDLHQFRADLKETPEPEVKWETVKTYARLKKSKIVEEIFRSPNEYWITEFRSVFSYFLKCYSLNEISIHIKHNSHLKIPLLARLYKKIKDTRFEDEPIIFLKEIIEE